MADDIDTPTRQDMSVDTSTIIDAAIDKVCYPPSKVPEVVHQHQKVCEGIVRKAAALGLDDKEILSEAVNVGLPEKLARQIPDGMKRRHNEIRSMKLLYLSLEIVD